MAATIGHIDTEILIRVGQGKPISIGSLNLPVTVTEAPGHMGTLHIDPAQVRASLSSAFAQASTSINSESH